MLLPDGTVALMGGNPTRGSYEQHIEIYSPAYLFNGDGSPALATDDHRVRPARCITATGFRCRRLTPVRSQSVVLVRPGSQTHAFDMDQRLVELSFTTGVGFADRDRAAQRQHRAAGLLHALHPQLGRRASVARFVRLATGAPANQAPTATITSPASNVTVNPGGSISFAGSGSDPDGTVASYAWTFAGGSPAASTEASTRNRDLLHAWQLYGVAHRDRRRRRRERCRHANDHGRRLLLSATPASRSVLPGAGTTYTATVAPIDGFTGTVSFDVLGLPSGASASFTPGVGVERWLDDARGVDERFYPDRHAHAHHQRHERPDHAEHDRHAHRGCREPGAHRDHHQPVVEHDHQSRRIDLVRRLWLRSRRERGVVRLELRRRQPGREHRGSTRSRDLLHAWQLYGFAHRDRQRRRRQRGRHANDHGRRLLTLGHAGVPQRPAGRGHDLHRHGGADQWLHRHRQPSTSSASPSGASASFTPASVASAGSTTLAVSTSAATPIGTYTLTIRGTSGPITRSTTVTLIVAAANQAPTATITSPASNMTVNPGGSISFAGSGADPDGTVASYAWSFGGGSPAASTQAAPGAVTYSTPGSYTASLIVTDNAGAASVAATRTITVANFSLSATPASRSVLPGAGTTYTATVAPINGFTGTVSFDVARPPLGRQRILHAWLGVERGLDDARGVDERVDPGRYLHAHHPRHERPDHEEHDRHARCGWKLFDLRLSAEPDRTQEREHDLRWSRWFQEAGSRVP